VFEKDFGVEIKVFFGVIILVVFAKHLAGVLIAAAPFSYSSELLIITLVSNKKYKKFYL